VISLKKYIASNDTERELMRVTQLLIQGIGLHAVEGDPDAYSGFRQGIDHVLRKVDEAASAADFLPQASSALKLLEEHNRRTTTYLKQKAVELQSMVRMLTAAVGAISTAGDENVRQLRDIEQQVESASQIEDMRLVKAKLGECLSQIRREAERQRTETGRTVEQLNQSLEGTQPAKPPAAGTDRVTGLPNRKEAEDALAKACQDQTPAYAVAVQIDRIQIFNARFGYEVGDDILRYFAKFLRQQWPGKDRMFRWTDTTILALLFRSSRLERVRDEVGRVMDHKYEHTVQTASRTVLLPISLRWAVFPMMSPPVLLVRNIDSLIGHKPAQ
jgi:diguanylate cyclase (GGDEF)-like protein